MLYPPTDHGFVRCSSALNYNRLSFANASFRFCVDVLLGDSSFVVSRCGGFVAELGRMLRTATRSLVRRLNVDVRTFKLDIAKDSCSNFAVRITGGVCLVEMRLVLFLLVGSRRERATAVLLLRVMEVVSILSFSSQ